ncbi:MAG: T9SS type A sorting domain-containing protein [Edaphocola sp.]
MATAQTAAVSLQIDATQQGQTIPQDYVGISAEQYTLSTGRWGVAGSFWTGGTAGTNRLQNLLHNLSDHSIVRLGGFTADQATRMVWQDTLRNGSTVLGNTYRDDVDKFFHFLDTIGWKAIYTINLPNNTLPRAISEASYLYDNYNSLLHSVSFGNEPYLYESSGYRTGYTPLTYLTDDYIPMYDTVKSVLPNLPISGCDCGARQYYGANNQQWNRTYTDTFNNLSGTARNIRSLNVHLYGLGNNATTLSTAAAADTLLNFNNAPSQNIQTLLPYMYNLSIAKNVPVRYSETNSAATGTDDTNNISRTYATAIWALQYLYTLAWRNIEGANFHSSGSSVYSMISWGNSATASAYDIYPVYYGLLSFADAIKHAPKLVQLTPQTTASNPRAAYFASKNINGDTMVITLINKDTAQTINAGVKIPNAGTIQAANSRTLHSDNGIFGKTWNVYYAGTQVAANGTFTPVADSSEYYGADSINVTVQPLSAKVVTINLANVPLPANSIALSGSNVPEGIKLNWSINIPNNIAYVKLEHAGNATDFKGIYATETNAQPFSYIHTQPTEGSNYYRLLVSDDRGNWYYSPIAKVNRQAATNKLSVWPNPLTSSAITVHLPTAPTQDETIVITDMPGTRILETVVPAGKTTVTINCQHLSPGTYLLKSSRYTTKFTKTN